MPAFSTSRRLSSTPTIRRLTRAECPSGTRIGVFNDLHIGCHDRPAANLAVELFEGAGVEVGVANGDIFDCGPVSPHIGKQRRAAMSNGQLLEEAASGREYIDWLLTRRLSLLGTGNHEDWINDVAVATNTVGTTTVRSALGIPNGIEVLPHGYQIRFGSLVIEHGDIALGRSLGGVNLAQTILRRYPDQTTIVGHYHRDAYAVRTSPDARGVLRSYAAHGIGHLSDPTAHAEYAGRCPDWQQSVGIIEVWYDGDKPRFTIDHVEIHRTRYGRPIAQYRGRVYR